MSDWKAGLDRYLTTPPDDGSAEWEAFCEKVYNLIPQEVQDEMEKKDFFCSDLEMKWMDKLSKRFKCSDADVDDETGEITIVESGDLEIEDIAAIITMAFKIYCK